MNFASVECEPGLRRRGFQGGKYLFGFLQTLAVTALESSINGEFVSLLTGQQQGGESGSNERR